MYNKYDEIDFSKIIAVSNRHLSRLPYLEQVERICSFRPKAFLLREKDLSEADYLELARDVKEICDRHGVPLIPHFYPKAAEVLGLDIVHLPLWKAKESRGSSYSKNNTIPQGPLLHIGVSVHSEEEALEAAALGASYLTAGHVFTTDCKKGVPPRGLPFLKSICRLASVPVYGIGGIRLDAGQISNVLEQGSAGACIMSQMMQI